MNTIRKLRKTINSINNNSNGIHIDKIRGLISISNTENKKAIHSRLLGLSTKDSTASDKLLVRTNTFNPDKNSMGLPIYKYNFILHYGTKGTRQRARIGIFPFNKECDHFMSFEFNPTYLGKTGQVCISSENHQCLGEDLKHIMGCGNYFKLKDIFKITRIDHTVDLKKIHMTDLLLSVKRIKTTMIIPEGFFHSDAETIKYGSRGAQFTVELYDKILEQRGKLNFLNMDWTRLEIRDVQGKTHKLTPANLQIMLAASNPFSNITIYSTYMNRSSFMKLSRASKQLLRLAHAKGINMALNSLCNKDKYLLKKILNSFAQFQISDAAWERYVKNIEQYFEFLQQ